MRQKSQFGPKEPDGTLNIEEVLTAELSERGDEHGAVVSQGGVVTVTVVVCGYCLINLLWKEIGHQLITWFCQAHL